MSSEELLLYSLQALVGICIVSLLIIAAQGLRIVLSRRALERRLESGRPALISLITDEAIAAEDLAPLRQIPAADQDELLIALGRRLDGVASLRLRDLAHQVGAVRRAAEWTRSLFWWRRLRGAQILTAVGGEEDLMLPLLDDPHPAIREQAVQWAAEHPTPAVIRAMLRLLQDPEDLSEFAILHSVIRMGPPVAEPISRYLVTWSGPALQRALRVAAARPRPQYAPAALRLASHPDSCVRAFAADILGAVGGAESAEALQRLLSDEDARVRSAAATGLGRSRFLPAAPEIAGLLRDPEWDVRRAAGLAVLEMGAVGRDLLLRAVTDDDPFASGMARQILDVVETGSGGT